jgi:hypothetical protein
MTGSPRKALFLFLVCCISIHAQAQNVLSGGSGSSSKIPPAAKVHQAPPGPKPIKHEVSFGFRLHTIGWSAFMDIGKVKASSTRTSDMFHDINFWQLEFSEKRSPKQEKVSSDGGASGSSGNYKYGKINNFYALKLGFGKRKMIAGKPDPGSVSIHWANMISGSLGMLKPYYLNVYDATGVVKPVKYSESPIFFDQRFIAGSSGFSQGLSEMKIIPGGHFKSMLHFDFSANKKSVAAVEAGFSIDYYSEAIPIMANQEAKPYFVDLFLSFQFGKRW